MIWEVAQKLSTEQRSFVLVTITLIRGDAPQDLGAKCLVTKDGLVAGTVGGGKIEAKAITVAQELLESSQRSAPLQHTWNLQKDIKMTCGGEMTLLFEHFPAAQWTIALFGAGHVGQALSRTLSKLQCQLTVIDSRKEWIDRLAGVPTKLIPTPKEAVRIFTKDTFFICMTQGHAHDVPILEQIFKHFPQAPYIGVIGSKTKALAIKKDLKALGVDDEFLEKLHIPMGLPLGSNDPEEISISIAAQCLQVRDQLAAASHLLRT